MKQTGRPGFERSESRSRQVVGDGGASPLVIHHPEHCSLALRMIVATKFGWVAETTQEVLITRTSR